MRFVIVARLAARSVTPLYVRFTRRGMATSASAPPTISPEARTAAQGLIDFLNASPSPYHAVAALSHMLSSAGFVRLSESASAWPALTPGGRYFLTRNQSAILAFAVGGRWEPAAGSFTVVGAHTDSPALKVKPISAQRKAGYASVGVETYGGLIQATWVDRDLSVAGRLLVERRPGDAHVPLHTPTHTHTHAHTHTGPVIESVLVRVPRPILRIPSVAIHLNREVNSEGMKLNAETQLVPMAGTLRVCEGTHSHTHARKAATEGGVPASPAAAPSSVAALASDLLSRHHSAFLETVAAAAGVSCERVCECDLTLFDTQPAALGGVAEEFVFGARLDNLCMTYSSFAGLLASVAPGSACPLEDDECVRVCASFDHEEVGSASVPGAGSTLLEDTLVRVIPDAVLRSAAIRRSLLISADMAHAVHPNYASLHEESHRPAMGGGLVIKGNANQRYATTAVTSLMLRAVAAELGVPTQLFVVRQDMGCGSTIGPIVAERLGMRTVDLGVPQLSMHSVRECCAAADVHHAVSFFSRFWPRVPATQAALVGTE